MIATVATAVIMRRRAGIMIIDTAPITTAVIAAPAPVIMAIGAEPEFRPKMALEP